MFQLLRRRTDEGLAFKSDYVKADSGMDPPIMTPKRLSRNIHTNVWEPTQASVGQSFFLPHTRRWLAAAGAAAAGEGGREKRAPYFCSLCLCPEGRGMDGGEGENSRERGKRERWFLATRLCRRQRQDHGPDD